MRKYAVELEESRLAGVDDIEDYQENVKLGFKERHRVFPAVFENRAHTRILDIAAGVGCAAQRIRDNYPADLLCSDISPTCLKILNRLRIQTVSFDIDDNETSFPFVDGHFDAVVSLVTIEHLIHVDHFVKEVHRILCNGGYFYIATPNYAAPEYWVPTIFLSGRTFHNPLGPQDVRYEFYGHVRYFTYRTLLEFVTSFGFVPDAVYLALPGGSSRYLAMYSASRIKALTARYVMWLKHHLLPPRWATEPILCFQKTVVRTDRRLRKVVL